MVVSMGMLLGWYVWMKGRVREGGRGWVLSSLNAGVCTVSGGRHLWEVWREGFGPLRLAPDPFLSRFTLIFFCSFLFLDLAVGLVEYPSQIGLLTGWIHHPIYAALLLFLLVRRSCFHFCLFMFEELPTLLFAIGYLFPPLRHDLLFGLSYLLTRILLHFYLIWNLYPDVLCVEFAIFVFPLHLYWFWEWLIQQRRLGRLQFLSPILNPPAKKGGKKESRKE